MVKTDGIYKIGQHGFLVQIKLFDGFGNGFIDKNPVRQHFKFSFLIKIADFETSVCQLPALVKNFIQLLRIEACIIASNNNEICQPRQPEFFREKIHRQKHIKWRCLVAVQAKSSSLAVGGDGFDFQSHRDC